jgi:hypothetical protein
MTNTESFVGSRFGFFVDGSTFLGFVRSVSGGAIKGEVAVRQTRSVQKKRIRNVIYEPFTIEVGMGMSGDFYNWIQASFDKGYIIKNGELVVCDFDYSIMSIREFQDAHISEVTIPALDGRSKEPAYMTVKFNPGKIRYKSSTRLPIQVDAGPATKKWMASNFRIELGDLPCDHVVKIDSFTVKQKIKKDKSGVARRSKKYPSIIEVPNLKLSISMADIQPWEQWYHSFIVGGKREDVLNGAITFLGPDLKDELARFDLQNVGIISMKLAKQEANKEEVARFEVELYVEQMKFSYNISDA